MTNVRIKAVVRVVLDVEADSVWSGETTWNQVAEQAANGVRGLFTNSNIHTLKDIPRVVKNIEVVEVKVRLENS